ncbi:hypothetical protein [Marinospirillum alkaliphilum]|uniref:Uncharacterized protein n=1 Tax=Marinospirillum alkaliphilum DSM 21637 TaxID=1122209 RepID=A0A1K1V776_9GAMM|nr:hypothetical protein [Marinospirillum alkaliphilum]SFX20595.1 hypothetical protein SAMN02745752_00800 [Marinospirillum alkaliphilum DSM 21637]
MSYTQVETALVYYPDVDQLDLTGYLVRGSLQLDMLDPSLFLYGGHQQLEDDQRVKWQYLGLGYHAPVDMMTEVWIGVGYDRYDSELTSWIDERSLPTFRVGIRDQYTPQAEFYATFRYMHTDEAIKGYSLGTRLSGESHRLALLLEVDYFAGQAGVLLGLSASL